MGRFIIRENHKTVAVGIIMGEIKDSVKNNRNKDAKVKNIDNNLIMNKGIIDFYEKLVS